MTKKLTLSLDEEVIQAGKEAAKERGISLSKLVENELRRIIREQRMDALGISPLVRSISGIANVSPGIDYKEARYEYLGKKHGV